MKGKKPPAKGVTRKPKQPVAKYQDGQIKVTAWKNKGEYGDMYSVVLKRVYQKDDEWHETDNLDLRDILAASNALKNIYDQIVKLRGHGIKLPPFGKKSDDDDDNNSGDDGDDGDDEGSEIPF